MTTNVLEYLEQTTAKTPENIAFADKDGGTSFAQLADGAKRIGSFLLRYHMKNAPIAVLMEKSPMCITAFMGVVYSGNFYTPIDATMPKERMLSILETLAPAVLLVDAKSQKQAEGLGVSAKILLLDELLHHAIDEPGLAAVRARFIDTDPLYAVFTSGSTGVPKGVVITHHAVINLTEWYTTALQITGSEVIGNQAPFYFDSSVKDIYAVLKTGARMEIIPKMLFSFPVKLMEYVAEKAVTYICWVPSALTMVVNTGTLAIHAPKRLQKIAFAGEIMPTKQFNVWQKTYPCAMFINIYGPTEATVDCTYYIVDRAFADDEMLPIGRACENTDVLILCADRLAVQNEVGELCIRGRCLSPGYYNNPEKTKEAFVQNPLNPHYPEMIYKTGDMARVNERGEIIFLARKDHQIKHMGHRIELGEIEAAVNSIDAVETGVCLYDTDTQRIVLLYCGADATQAHILKQLRDKIPKYMFPNVMLLMDKMPQTLNGKIDRLRLKEYYDERNAGE